MFYGCGCGVKVYGGVNHRDLIKTKLDEFIFVDMAE
jgi:hypothetical protein